METEDKYILAIESSCDDTSAAVMHGTILLSNVTASQDVHKAYGGVVPELASRAHQQNVLPVVDQAIKKAGITKEHLLILAGSGIQLLIILINKLDTVRKNDS